ncbi:type I-E CRISPR-associated protein Cas7/Cse4/CasC [Lipingzhangella sp. LS1_29]|uniref:Type I-E CRISPR-associated protein Cas7/Cse4/CasC n=1 Tax=Lipingzhangella rawalii TaxID=2055835 RepID=A0ABU2H5G4_9ACTN|nr:type I-E CRISPR-associated protein Cas7/Cse4/CasC [Lipingzhangella rawalii]MDS1270531.1 type I-E CRISPR-associated protein Cas7/Cse4/CasC [Lipingzhangella rawalii]
MIIELHLLQSFPASNLNRDDVGQPKSVTFGGVQRGRVSSQCLKRSARLLLPQLGLALDNTGVRTKRLVERTARVLDGADPAGSAEPSDQSRTIAREGLRRLGFEVDTNDLSQYLFYVGQEAVNNFAAYCRTHEDKLLAAAEERAQQAQMPSKSGSRTKKPKPDRETVDAGHRILDASHAVDIALFGRMVANNTNFNVTAASQVAHAFSTHAVATEFDYYTAVDDLRPDGEPGADMIGTVDFNAACYYRYANLDLQQLRRNLTVEQENLVTTATRAWLEAFIRAVPSGKQNSMAAHTRPDALLAVVREYGSWNLANAFLAPVTGTDLMADSTKRLAEHFRDLRQFYGDEGVRSVTVASVSNCNQLTAAGGEHVTSLAEFTERVTTAAQD